MKLTARLRLAAGLGEASMLLLRGAALAAPLFGVNDCISRQAVVPLMQPRR